MTDNQRYIKCTTSDSRALLSCKARGIGFTALLTYGLLSGQQVIAKDAPAAATVFAAYTLVAPVKQVPSGLLARAVVPAGVSCPMLHANHGNNRGKALWHDEEMTERKAPESTRPAFTAVRVCEAMIPKDALEARIGPFTIPARLPKQMSRIAVFGDTGCRVGQQDCTDPEQWPLARIAEHIAAAKPQVILFLGDFFYREIPCPDIQTRWCGGTPAPIPTYGFLDTDYSWIADALIPMRSVFSTAPLLVLRGNHEACKSGGNGYFLFFDPRRDTAAVCTPKSLGGDVPINSITDPWSTVLPIRPDWKLQLVLVDSASPYQGDFDVISHGTDWAEANRASFQRAAELTQRQRGVESWLLVHRPIFGVAYKTPCPNSSSGGCYLWSSVPVTAASYGLLDHYNLILSSHLHLTQAAQIPGQPPQLAIGNGGTALYDDVPYPIPVSGPLEGVQNLPPWVTSVYPPAQSLWTAVRHGYVLLYPGAQRGHWTWQHHAPDGKQFARCVQAGKTLDCRLDKPIPSDRASDPIGHRTRPGH